MLPSVNFVVNTSLLGLRDIVDTLMPHHSRPRVYANVVVITLNDHFVAAVTFVVPMPVVIVVVVVVMVVPRVRRSTTEIAILFCRTDILPSNGPPMVMVVVVVMMMMTVVGQRRPPTDVNVVIVSLYHHYIVGVLRTVMMIVMIRVMMVVVVAVSWMRVGVWSATVKNGVAIHPFDVNERPRPGIFLCWLLWWCSERWAKLVRLMRLMIQRIAPSQKGR